MYHRTARWPGSGACGFFLECIPISKRYTLTYPDGSRKNISREERDSLLLSKQAKQTAADRYAYTGQVRTFHSFADLKHLTISRGNMLLRRFLAGRFVFEHKSKRRPELLETPEAMVLRLGL